MSVEANKNRRLYQMGGRTIIIPFDLVPESDHELAKRIIDFLNAHPEEIKSGGNIYLEQYGKKRFHFMYAKGSNSILELHEGSHGSGLFSTIFG